MSRRSVLWAVVAVLVLTVGVVAYAMGTDAGDQPVAGQDEPMPVEPDEGPGDSPMPVEPDEGPGDSPMPVEPDEGIGDTPSDTGY